VTDECRPFYKNAFASLRGFIESPHFNIRWPAFSQALSSLGMSDYYDSFSRRLGHKRSLARKTAFDAILIVILASVLSHAVNGSAAFFPTLGGGLVLIKGQPDIIVEDGKVERRNVRRNDISMHDLQEDLRLNAKTEDLDKIKVARIERSGDISFIKREE
jgi:hypothetical protein